MRHACLMQRGMPVTRSTWQLGTSIIWNLTDETGITDTRLWSIVTRFFAQAATVVEESPPATAERLRSATPHRMLHTRSRACFGCRRRADHGVRQPGSLFDFDDIDVQACR